MFGIENEDAKYHVKGLESLRVNRGKRKKLGNVEKRVGETGILLFFSIRRNNNTTSIAKMNEVKRMMEVERMEKVRRFNE